MIKDCACDQLLCENAIADKRGLIAVEDVDDTHKNQVPVRNSFIVPIYIHKL